MRKFSKLELKAIESMVLESMESDSMDVHDFLNQVREGERREEKLTKVTKLKLKNMLGKITCKFVKI